jgi:hypothetical protein
MVPCVRRCDGVAAVRTRRSPRNQEVLWRELGGRRATVACPSIDQRIATLRDFIASPFTSKRARANAEREIASIQLRAAVAKATGAQP